MEEDYPLTNALEETAIYIQDLEHSIEERHIETELSITYQGEDYDLIGHQCETDDNVYFIVGNQELRFLLAACLLSVSQNVGLMLDIGTVEAIVEDDEEEEINLREEAGGTSKVRSRYDSSMNWTSDDSEVD